MTVETTSVLKNCIKVMDCFSVARTSLGVREIARLVEMPPSTVGRIVIELRQIGLLQQMSDSREYQIGSKSLEWSGVYLTSIDLRKIAIPLMENLNQTTGETITLYLLDGFERLCIERIESHQNIRMVTRVGQRLPLYAGSAGKVMLAYLSIGKIEEMLKTVDLIPYTSSTCQDKDQLRTEIDQIKTSGYAVSHGEWIQEASGVAAPILGLRNEVLGGISISGPSTRFTQEQIQQYSILVVRTGQAISRAMGYIVNQTF